MPRQRFLLLVIAYHLALLPQGSQAADWQRQASGCSAQPHDVGFNSDSQLRIVAAAVDMLPVRQAPRGPRNRWPRDDAK